eukprot:Blabericola_migrator_1__1928@NODE_1524_length_4345_cov_29_891772_g1003_i0_p1_GENE_NODE_1524_length_4345_cov_29_891772_g1003_i0NODE_1524_length_4345_cov_29_891772_g1003_i0_p1_ORF_typecomplete_len1312_score98_27_NODE_1524_length_4345_cov_29_891772_g1003_i03804315
MNTPRSEDTAPSRRSRRSANHGEDTPVSSHRRPRPTRQQGTPVASPSMDEAVPTPRRVRDRPHNRQDSRTNSPIWAAAKALEERYWGRSPSRKRSTPEGEPSSGGRGKRRAVGRWSQPDGLACRNIDNMALARVTGLAITGVTADRIRFLAAMAHDPSSDCEMTTLDASVDRKESLGRDLETLSRRLGRVISTNTIGTTMENLHMLGVPLQQATSIIRYLYRERGIPYKDLVERSARACILGYNRTQAYYTMQGVSDQDLPRRVRGRLAQQLRRGRQLSPRSRVMVSGHENDTSPESASTVSRDNRWLSEHQRRRPLRDLPDQLAACKDEADMRELPLQEHTPRSMQSASSDSDEVEVMYEVEAGELEEELPLRPAEDRVKNEMAEEEEDQESDASWEARSVRSYQSTVASEARSPTRRRGHRAPRNRQLPPITEAPLETEIQEGKERVAQQAMLAATTREAIQGLLRGLQDFAPHFEGEVPFFDWSEGPPRPLSFATQVFMAETLGIYHEDRYQEPSATHVNLRTSLPGAMEFIRDAETLRGYTNQRTEVWNSRRTAPTRSASVFFRSPPGLPETDSYMMTRLVATMAQERTTAVWFQGWGSSQIPGYSPPPRLRYLIVGWRNNIRHHGHASYTALFPNIDPTPYDGMYDLYIVYDRWHAYPYYLAVPTTYHASRIGNGQGPYPWALFVVRIAQGREPPNAPPRSGDYLTLNIPRSPNLPSGVRDAIDPWYAEPRPSIFHSREPRKGKYRQPAQGITTTIPKYLNEGDSVIFVFGGDCQRGRIRITEDAKEWSGIKKTQTGWIQGGLWRGQWRYLEEQPACLRRDAGLQLYALARLAWEKNPEGSPLSAHRNERPPRAGDPLVDIRLWLERRAETWYELACLYCLRSTHAGEDNDDVRALMILNGYPRRPRSPPHWIDKWEELEIRAQRIQMLEECRRNASPALTTRPRRDQTHPSPSTAAATLVKKSAWRPHERRPLMLPGTLEAREQERATQAAQTQAQKHFAAKQRPAPSPTPARPTLPLYPTSPHDIELAVTGALLAERETRQADPRRTKHSERILRWTEEVLQGRTEPPPSFPAWWVNKALTMLGLRHLREVTARREDITLAEPGDVGEPLAQAIMALPPKNIPDQQELVTPRSRSRTPSTPSSRRTPARQQEKALPRRLPPQLPPVSPISDQVERSPKREGKSRQAPAPKCKPKVSFAAGSTPPRRTPSKSPTRRSPTTPRAKQAAEPDGRASAAPRTTERSVSPKTRTTKPKTPRPKKPLIIDLTEISEAGETPREGEPRATEAVQEVSRAQTPTPPQAPETK